MEARGRSRRRNVDGCTVVECYTPRRVVARWLFGPRSEKGKREEERKESDDDDDYTGPLRCSTKCLNEGFPLSPAPAPNRFESQSREASMDAGIGSLLLYLVVASKTELDKMAKLRMQMEMLIQNAREELRRKELQETPLKSSNYKTLYPREERGEIQEPNDNQITPQVISNLASSILEESSTNVVHNECTECEVSKPEEYVGGTDRESKLEAELRSLHLNGKASERRMVHQRQQKVKDTGSKKSNKTSGEVTDERFGVCPYELERRLQELLSKRQREEIRELETALSRVERRLDEKETEVSWWKDAASLLAQRVPESSRAGLEYCIPESVRTQPERSVPGSSKAAALKRRVSQSR